MQKQDERREIAETVGSTCSRKTGSTTGEGKSDAQREEEEQAHNVQVERATRPPSPPRRLHWRERQALGAGGARRSFLRMSSRG